MKIFNYLKYLAFYFILLVESFLNLLCAAVGCYPALDWSTAFLAWFEFRRVGSIVAQRANMRTKLENSASEKMSEAKRLDNGQDEEA